MSDTIEVFAPFDGSLVGSVKVATEANVEDALTNAHALFRNKKTWLSKQERIRILKRTAEILKNKRETIALQAATEGGKPLKDSLVEVDRGIEGLQCCIDQLRTEAGVVVPMGLNATSADKVAFTLREPIGVVVGVSAFNHPFNLIVHQVAPAVAVGAPVIIKPAASTPLSCQAFLDALYEAGLPREWAVMLLPDNHDIVTKLVTDERVAFFSFIGSSRVGWMLRSKLAAGTRCALEHGGIAPVIVAADAEISLAATKLAHGGFWHAGQACVSVQRVFCHTSIAEELASQIGILGDKYVTGDPRLITTDMGPLIHNKEVQRVANWVNTAVSGGAKLVSGGRQLSESCYSNTVLLNPSADAEISQHEVFGPVICVYAFDDLEQAIWTANNVPYAFQSSVFTQSLDTAMQCYRQLDGTSIMINESTLFRVDWMPFAGARQSGHGVGGIPHSMLEMQTEKMMVWRSAALLGQ